MHPKTEGILFNYREVSNRLYAMQTKCTTPNIIDSNMY